MSLEEISKQYGISTELLIRFIEIGVFEKDDFITQNGTYKPYVLRRVNDCQCLSFIGLTTKDVKAYMCLQEDDRNSVKEQVELLNSVRIDCLKNMHNTKRKLDCISDIVQKLNKNKEEIGGKTR